MERNKILTPIILGLLVALAVTGAYTIAHTSSYSPETYAPTPVTGMGSNMHMGMMGMMGMMGAMGQPQAMMQENSMGQQQLMRGPGPRGPMAGFQSHLETIEPITVEGTVVNLDLQHHSITIDTSSGIVEIMVPGFWVTPQETTVTWYELISGISAGETVIAEVIPMPCGESIAVSLTIDGITYDNAMISMHQ